MPFRAMGREAGGRGETVAPTMAVTPSQISANILGDHPLKSDLRVLIKLESTLEYYSVYYRVGNDM